MKPTPLTLDQKLDRLRNGETLITSKGNGITCTAERSGDGKTLRFVRTQANGSWEVYHKVRFN